MMKKTNVFFILAYLSFLLIYKFMLIEKKSSAVGSETDTAFHCFGYQNPVIFRTRNALRMPE